MEEAKVEAVVQTTEVDPRTTSQELKWDEIGERYFETGTKKGVVYPFNTANKSYDSGYAWNGLTGVDESPSGAEATPMWADDTKYVNLISAEEYGFSIKAFTYPPEFEQCDGSASLVAGVSIGQQARKMFGFSYVSTIGNDTEGLDAGYKIHLIYGAQAAPSEKSRSTVNDSPEGVEFSWECSTTPVPVTGHKPTSVVEIDSRTVDATKLKALETILYGSQATAPRLPLPDEIKTLMTVA